MSPDEEKFFIEIDNYLGAVLDDLDEIIGTPLVGREPLKHIQMRLESQGDGTYIAYFTDSGPPQNKLDRLSTVVSTLSISRYADVRGPLEITLPESRIRLKPRF